MKYFPFCLVLFCQILLIDGRPTDEFEPSTIVPMVKTNPSGMLSIQENEELQKTCGFHSDSEKKSIGSEAARRKDAPWVVGMAMIRENTTSTYPVCSASLISSRHVLTAWHCVSLKNLSNLRFVFDDDCSASDTFAECSIENAIVRKAVKVVSPKVYTRDFLPGHMDIAIIELDEPIKFGLDLYPACMSETSPSVADILDLYSFGYDDKFNDTLTGALQHIQLETEACLSEDFSDTICTKHATQKRAIGDSGGGLIFKTEERAYVAGVISGFSLDVKRRNVDVAVAPHLHWICQHLGICVVETKSKQLSFPIDTITFS